MSVNVENFQFKRPFTCLVAGPTSCGKTVLVRQLLQSNKLFIKNIKNTPKVLWMYGQWQKAYDEHVANTDIEYIEGLLTLQSIVSQNVDILVVDDLMNELGGNIALSNLFTKGSHHLNISVLFVDQDVFHQAKQMRNISLNAHYLILFKNPRDRSQILHLARQLYPTNIIF